MLPQENAKNTERGARRAPIGSADGQGDVAAKVSAIAPCLLLIGHGLQTSNGTEKRHPHWGIRAIRGY